MNTILASCAFTLIGIFLLAVSRELEREKANCMTLGVRALALLAGLVGMAFAGLYLLL
jgi:hypothetical protein